jgi:hypothetical protein
VHGDSQQQLERRRACTSVSTAASWVNFIRRRSQGDRWGDKAFAVTTPVDSALAGLLARLERKGARYPVPNYLLNFSALIALTIVAKCDYYGLLLG